MVYKQKKIQDLVRSNYSPPTKPYANWSFQDYIGHNNIRYFSFARHALYEALKLCNVKSGDKVLLPGFICREILSAINTIGAIPEYYEVTSNLQIQSIENLSSAKVIIVVNYFGFSSNLDLIKKYCSENNILIIEDNSHGFLSSDLNNKPLGTRTNIGIFSIRKTLPVVNGAALVINDLKSNSRIVNQIDYDKSITPSIRQHIKRIIKNLLPKNKYNFIFLLIKIKQAIRYYLKGSFVANSSLRSEYDLPNTVKPHIDLIKYMKTISFHKEIERRRLLYNYLVDYIGNDVEVIFKKLEPNTIPYVFPFRSNNIEYVRTKLKKISLGCYRWPELPEKIYLSCPKHYKNVWMVPFLW